MAFQHQLGPAALAALLAFSAPAAAGTDGPRRYLNDACVAREADRPSLRHDLLPSARFRRVESLVDGQRDAAGRPVETWFRSAEETGRLPGGVELTVRLEGCESYAMIYEFRLPGSRRSLSDQRGWLTEAARLMAAVRRVTVKDEPIRWAELDRALSLAARTRSARAAHDQTAFEWETEQGGEDGVGAVTVRVRAEHRGPADVLTVSYYVGL